MFFLAKKLNLTQQKQTMQGKSFFPPNHRRQHVSTDDADMSKHIPSPYKAYYHNWLTLNCLIV